MGNSVRIGTNPIAWSNDDMQSLGGATPLDTCLREAAEAGFEGIELGHKFPRTAEALRPVLAPHSLDLISGWYSSELLNRSVEEEIANLQAHLTLLKDMGSRVIVWAETTGCVHGLKDTPLKNRRIMTEEEWPLFCQKLSAVAAYVKSEGMTIAYHHHMGTVVETEDEVIRMMDNTSDDVGLLLDTGHLTFAGANPLRIAERFKDRIRHVHCKDVRTDVFASFKDGSRSFLDAVIAGVFTVPGDGSVDFLPIFQVLAGVGYKGWLVVEAEQDPEKANPLQYAKLGCATLQKLSLEAGLRCPS